MAGLWAGSALEAVVVSDRVGDASALKLAYASWSKASQALLLAARAAAEAAGVGPWLVAEWERSNPDLRAATDRAARSATKKGWRWAGEMEEVAAFLADNGLPEGFHLAAAELFGRVPRPDVATATPDLGVLLAGLRAPAGRRSALAPGPAT